MDHYDTHAQDTQNKQLSELIDMRLSKLFHWFRKRAWKFWYKLLGDVGMQSQNSGPHSTDNSQRRMWSGADRERNAGEGMCHR